MRSTSYVLVCSRDFLKEGQVRASDTYTTGKTFGKTTLASAKYSYRIRWSNSSVVYFTNVAYDNVKD